MKQNSVRARIMLAFANDKEILTRPIIFSRANTDDNNEFLRLVQGSFIAKLTWRPNTANTYQITQRGLELRKNFEPA